MKAKLISTRGKLVRKEFPVDNKNGLAIALGKERIEVRFDRDREIYVLKSTGMPVAVNGIRLEEKNLEDGDRIAVGKNEFTFVLPQDDIPGADDLKKPVPEPEDEHDGREDEFDESEGSDTEQLQKIEFCARCGVPVTGDDYEETGARKIDRKVFCGICAEDVLKPGSERKKKKPEKRVSSSETDEVEPEDTQRKRGNSRDSGSGSSSRRRPVSRRRARRKKTVHRTSARKAHSGYRRAAPASHEKRKEHTDELIPVKKEAAHRPKKKKRIKVRREPVPVYEEQDAECYEEEPVKSAESEKRPKGPGMWHYIKKALKATGVFLMLVATFVFRAGLFTVRIICRRVLIMRFRRRIRSRRIDIGKKVSEKSRGLYIMTDALKQTLSKITSLKDGEGEKADEEQHLYREAGETLYGEYIESEDTLPVAQELRDIEAWEKRISELKKRPKFRKSGGADKGDEESVPEDGTDSEKSGPSEKEKDGGSEEQREAEEPDAGRDEKEKEKEKEEPDVEADTGKDGSSVDREEEENGDDREEDKEKDADGADDGEDDKNRENPDAEEEGEKNESSDDNTEGGENVQDDGKESEKDDSSDEKSGEKGKDDKNGEDTSSSEGSEKKNQTHDV